MWRAYNDKQIELTERYVGWSDYIDQIYADRDTTLLILEQKRNAVQNSDSLELIRAAANVTIGSIATVGRLAVAVPAEYFLGLRLSSELERGWVSTSHARAMISLHSLHAGESD